MPCQEITPELQPSTSGQSDTAVQQSRSPFNEQFKSATEAASQSQDIPDIKSTFLMRLSPQDILQGREDLHHSLRILWTVKRGIRFNEGEMLCIY